jgi:hemerythrin superfamily protein
MDAITLLKQDHRAVKKLFSEFEKAAKKGTGNQRKLAGEIVRELSVHAAIEEQVFYPAVREAVPDAEDHVLESLEEHHLVKLVAAELEDMTPDDERFKAKMTVMMENVRHHIEEEEQELFPQVRSALGRTSLSEIGAALEEAKKKAPTRPRPAAPDTPPGNIESRRAAAVLDRARDAVREPAG